jgi:hypothetical protein
MIAVDANVVVRVLTAHVEPQTAAAGSLFSGSPVWVAKTVFGDRLGLALPLPIRRKCNPLCAHRNLKVEKCPDRGRSFCYNRD